MRVHRPILLLLLSLAACEGPVAIEPDDVRLTVVVDAAAQPPESNVEFQVRNVGSPAVYVVDHCDQIVIPQLERREGSAWVHAPTTLGCLDNHTPSLLLRRNESVSGTLSVHTPGRYRVQVRVAPSSESPGVAVYQEFDVGL
jgi:hypothetical protein